jgi:hypothetical protein
VVLRLSPTGSASSPAARSNAPKSAAASRPIDPEFSPWNSMVRVRELLVDGGVILAGGGFEAI